MASLEAFGTSQYTGQPRPLLPVAALGTEFPNPLGVAAGIDREGSLLGCPDFAAYGFIEVGTICGGDEASAVASRLSAAQLGGRRVGVNIGSRSDGFGDQVVRDYTAALTEVWPAVDYVVANLTSPVAPQRAAGGGELACFLAALRGEADGLRQLSGRRVPLLVKINGTDRAGLLAAWALGFDGAVAVGGPEDGVDLASLSAELAPMHLISVGGIRTSADMTGRLAAGAKLVQVFTAALSGGAEFAPNSIAHLTGRAKERLR